MAIKTIYKLNNERITSDSIVHQDEENYQNLKTYLNSLKIKVTQLEFAITPSNNRGGNGFGTTTLDISSLNASKILSISFGGENASNFMLFGCTSNLLNSPKNLNLYGYRMGGTWTGPITGNVVICYL